MPLESWNTLGIPASTGSTAAARNTRLSQAMQSTRTSGQGSLAGTDKALCGLSAAPSASILTLLHIQCVRCIARLVNMRTGMNSKRLQRSTTAGQPAPIPCFDGMTLCCAERALPGSCCISVVRLEIARIVRTRRFRRLLLGTIHFRLLTARFRFAFGAHCTAVHTGRAPDWHQLSLVCAFSRSSPCRAVQRPFVC